MFKKAITIILALAILLGMGGCMKQKVKYTNEEKKEMVLEYLKNKYDEEFEGIVYTPEQLLQGHDEFYVYPKNGTREDAFQVWGVTKEDGTYKMEDGYFGVIIHDEYQEVVEGVVGEVFDEFKVIVNSMSGVTFPERLNKDTKVSEIYNENEYFSPEIVVYVKSSSEKTSNFDNDIDKIKNKFIENKLCSGVRLYLVDDEKFGTVGIIKGSSTNKGIFKKRSFILTKDLEVAEYGTDEDYGEE